MKLCNPRLAALLGALELAAVDEKLVVVFLASLGRGTRSESSSLWCQQGELRGRVSPPPVLSVNIASKQLPKFVFLLENANVEARVCRSDGSSSLLPRKQSEVCGGSQQAAPHGDRDLCTLLAGARAGPGLNRP